MVGSCGTEFGTPAIATPAPTLEQHDNDVDPHLRFHDRTRLPETLPPDRRTRGLQSAPMSGTVEGLSPVQQRTLDVLRRSR